MFFSVTVGCNKFSRTRDVIFLIIDNTLCDFIWFLYFLFLFLSCPRQGAIRSQGGFGGPPPTQGWGSGEGIDKT